MASLTLANARTVVRDFLDAANDTARFPNATIDLHLRGALSMALRRYVRGGDTALVETVATATTSAGLVALSSYDPIDIRGVSLANSDGSAVPIVRAQGSDRGAPAGVVNVEVTLVRKYSVPGTDSLALVYNASAPATALSNEAFDFLVCAAAAVQLAAKDVRRRADLEQILARYEAAVMTEPPIVRSAGPALGRRDGGPRTSYRWWWDGANQRVAVVVSRGR